MNRPTCSVPGCTKPTRSRNADLCAMHYHRQYRHGDVHRTANTSGITVSLGRMYRALNLPRHPLAGKSGKVYEHRAVLFDRIGPGAHGCHWCGSVVHWDPTDGPALQVDHLNSLKDDNRPENLVPSCGGCNVARAQQARSRALREAGWWSGNDTVARLRRGGRREALPIVTESDTPGPLPEGVPQAPDHRGGRRVPPRLIDFARAVD
ncbi:HNH endonuclease [Micromonospora aurantiaca (nom. illeg.)]|uniref:HNH endonuclease n=1 Tax=Micromonospora aurantiaca (nom. illeg.) TaxID=47850 RepID=UPI003EB90D6E